LNKLDKWADWLAEGKVGPVHAAVAAAALYCAFQTISLSILTGWFAPGVGIDDAEQLIYLPFLQAGYGGSQPPIYTWINWLAAQLLGTNIFTLKAVKYLLFFLALWGVYAAVRGLGFTRRTAAAALFATLLFPQVGWEMQRALSHSVAALAFAALTLLALVHLVRRQTLVSYGLLGLVIAAAVLGKYNNLLFLGALFAAALTVRDFRAVLVDRRIVLTIAVALLAMAPTLLWNVQNPDTLLARTEKFGIGHGSGAVSTALKGLQQTLGATLVFSILPAAVFAVGAWFAGARLRDLRHTPLPAERFVWRVVGFGVLLVALLVLFSGTTNVRARWLMPVLFLVPAAIAVSSEALGAKARKAQNVVIFCGVVMAILITPALWHLQLLGSSGLGRTVRLDYPSIYRDLLDKGPVRTVVSDESWIGNLRFVDPGLNILTEEVPYFATRLEDPAVLIWLNVPCPRGEVLQPLLRAGYTLDERIETLAVPERFGGTRNIYATRLKRQDAPDTVNLYQSRICSEWWRERRSPGSNDH